MSDPPRYRPGDVLITMEQLARPTRKRGVPLLDPPPKSKLPLSKVEIYRRIARGEFPTPIRLGGPHGRVAWIEREVDEWLAARAERAA